tara:strand:- start:4332 stop:5792 length:1461 start_codon:yes stop_codon:yes gene_type:complete
MKLFILGLIILLIVVCQIYKIIKEKRVEKNIENMTSEDYDEFLKHENDFTDQTIRYYEELNNGKVSQDMKYTLPNFVHLNTQNQLIFDDYAGYKNSIEGFHGENIRKKTGNNIEKCRALTECGMLDKPGYEDCGYCGTLGDKVGGGTGGGYNQKGKFEYMPASLGGKKIGPDVCPADALEAHPPKSQDKKQPLGNRWATSSYDCKKIQLQDTCSSITDCNEMSGDLAEKCGWCPSNKAYPKDSADGILYPTDNIPNADSLHYSSVGAGKTQIKGDTCAAFNETYTDGDGNLKQYYAKLQTADDCSICDQSGGQITTGGVKKWSEGCIKQLWANPHIDSESLLKVGCTTEYDSPPNDENIHENGGIYEKNFGDKLGRPNYRWGYSKWYKIQNEMKQNVVYPIFRFKRDYNTMNGSENIWRKGDELLGTGEIEAPDTLYRRKWKMDEIEINQQSSHDYNNPNVDIKELWKKCFNKDNPDNKDQDNEDV